MLKPVSLPFWLTGIPYGKRLKYNKVLLLTIGLPQNILKYTGHIADLTGRGPLSGHLLSEHFYSTLKKIKSMRYIILTACLAMFIGASCKKNKPTKTELEKLPPITQSGANTFGCLVNGKAWIPKGYQFKPNFFIIVDPTFQNGNFDLRTYQYAKQEFERINIFSNGIRNNGNYSIKPGGPVFVDFRSDFFSCYYLHSVENFSSGSLKITKYDLQNGIVSGEFECTLYDSTINCDTIKITNGRFDYRL